MPDWTSLRRAGSAFLPGGPGRRRPAGQDPEEPDPAAAGSASGDGDGDDADGRNGAAASRAGDPDRPVVPRPHVDAATALARLGGLVGDAPLASAAAVTTPGGRPVLAGRRLERAAVELAGLDEAGQARVARQLAGAPDVLRAYLLLTLATGRGPDLVDALAAAVDGHARDMSWLHRHLGVVLGGPGPVAYEDDTGARLRLRQSSPQTAGPAAMIVFRVLIDPTYGYWLTTGVHVEPGREPDHLPFEQRFRSQQTRVLDAITRRSHSRTPLRGLLGSSPSGSARFLNRFTRLTGARFEWHPVDGGDPAQVTAALDTVQAGLDAGLTVPAYVGGHVDRTVVLAIGRTPEALRLYDPARGEVLDVPVADVVGGRPVAGGWDRLEGLLAPRDLG